MASMVMASDVISSVWLLRLLWFRFRPVLPPLITICPLFTPAALSLEQKQLCIRTASLGSTTVDSMPHVTPSLTFLLPIPQLLFRALPVSRLSLSLALGLVERTQRIQPTAPSRKAPSTGPRPCGEI